MSAVFRKVNWGINLYTVLSKDTFYKDNMLSRNLNTHFLIS